MHTPLDTAVLGRRVMAEAARDPHRLLLLFENAPFPDELVYAGDLAVRANQLAFALRRAGFVKGDRVAILLRNHPEFVYALIANSLLGLISVPIDPRAHGEKLRYFLTFADCSGLITADYVMMDETATQVILKTGMKTWIVASAEGQAQGIDASGSWPTVNEVLAGSEREYVGQHVDQLTDPWLLAYTSGTTGNPKAILSGYNRMLFYHTLPTFFGYHEDDVLYTGLSLTHGNALVVTMLPALWGKVHHAVLSRWFTRTRLWDICITYGCTIWSNSRGHRDSHL